MDNRSIPASCPPPHSLVSENERRPHPCLRSHYGSAMLSFVTEPPLLGYLAHKTPPPFLGLPQGLRHSSTVSHERGTPLRPCACLRTRCRSAMLVLF